MEKSKYEALAEQWKTKCSNAFSDTVIHLTKAQREILAPVLVPAETRNHHTVVFVTTQE